MTPDHVTATPSDAARYERAHGPEADVDRNEARDSDFQMPFTDCGSCNKSHCLMCALDRVFQGWRP